MSMSRKAYKYRLKTNSDTEPGTGMHSSFAGREEALSRLTAGIPPRPVPVVDIRQERTENHRMVLYVCPVEVSSMLM